MDESKFEGTSVLEKLAEIGKVDAFIDAVDSDDFNQAKLDTETLTIVLKKMNDADGEN